MGWIDETIENTVNWAQQGIGNAFGGAVAPVRFLADTIDGKDGFKHFDNTQKRLTGTILSIDQGPGAIAQRKYINTHDQTTDKWTLGFADKYIRHGYIAEDLAKSGDTSQSNWNNEGHLYGAYLASGLAAIGGGGGAAAGGATGAGSGGAAAGTGAVATGGSVFTLENVAAGASIAGLIASGNYSGVAQKFGVPRSIADGFLPTGQQPGPQPTPSTGYVAGDPWHTYPSSSGGAAAPGMSPSLVLVGVAAVVAVAIIAAKKRRA